MRRTSSGFTLVEVVIALAVLSIALFGMIAVIGFSARNNKMAKERMLALRAAEKQIEIMKAMPVNQIMASYPTTPVNKRLFSVFNDNDPATVNVPALVPDPNAQIVFPSDSTGSLAPLQTAFIASRSTSSGQILFPTDAAGALREDLTAAFTGRATNIDLDESGAIETTDKSANCKTLPVQIVVSWKGVAGPSQLVLNYIISR